MKSNPVCSRHILNRTKRDVYTKHILFGNYEQKASYINPYAEMVKDIKITARLWCWHSELKQDLSFLTEGLSIRGLFNATRYSYFDVSRFYTPYYYSIGSYDKGCGHVYVESVKQREWERIFVLQRGKGVYSTTYLELAAQYNRTFHDKHAVVVVGIHSERI